MEKKKKKETKPTVLQSQIFPTAIHWSSIPWVGSELYPAVKGSSAVQKSLTGSKKFAGRGKRWSKHRNPLY